MGRMLMPYSKKSSPAAISNKHYLPTSDDPLGYDGGSENLYRYCGDAPISLVDPTGMANISPEALACIRNQLQNIQPKLSQEEIDVRMRIIESLASTSGANMHGDPSCQDWANCTILNSCGVTPNGSYSDQADKCTNTNYYTPQKPLDPSCLKPGDQIHFKNPYYNSSTDNQYEIGCNTFVVGRDCRGILLYNRWARCSGSGFNESQPGIMTMEQYCKWMSTWPSVIGRSPDPQFPINRVRCPLPQKKPE